MDGNLCEEPGITTGPPHSESKPTQMYTPLDHNTKQLRLLSFRGKNEFELRTFDLDTAPEYFALSYCWGPEQPQGTMCHVVVNGVNFAIRNNLAMALNCYQKLHLTEGTIHRPPIELVQSSKSATVPRPGKAGGWPKIGYLFVDAICINQNSPLERNHQVEMMGQIFSTGVAVLVWLGLEHEAIEAWDRRWDEEYWGRVWTFQEYVLARQIWFLTIDKIIERPTSWQRAMFNMTPTSKLRTRCFDWGRDNLHTTGNLTLDGVLSWTKNLKCSNPLDTVFAVIGCVQDWRCCRPIVPDYSLTPSSLYESLRDRYRISPLNMNRELLIAVRMQSKHE